ncbi:MAG: hypothetical protein N2C12_17995, partial [Planctomycetales bacterium]
PSDRKAVAKQVPLPPLKLLGTMIEPGKSVAMLQNSSGKVILRSVGDFIDVTSKSVKVQSIERETVMVHYRGQDVQIKKLPK